MQSGVHEINDRITLILGDMLDYTEYFCRDFSLVITDPPYGVEYVSNRRVARAKFDMIEGDDGIDPDWFWFCEVVKDTGALYCFTNWKAECEFKKYISAYDNIKIKNQIVWDKLNHGAGDLTGAYGDRHEIIWFATGENFKLKSGRPETIIQVSKVSGAVSLHPTQKPIDLIRKLFSAVLEPGEDALVLDPFMGSGGTGVVAAERGHRYIGIEKDPKYFKTAYREISTMALQQRLF